jgi:hypothetical protein
VVIHRLIGLSYVVLYLLLMVQMVPRVFEYQIEFSTRTIAHLMLGVTIGLISHRQTGDRALFQTLLERHPVPGLWSAVVCCGARRWW